MKYININADASYSDRFLIGGYGIYIRAENFKMKQSGVFKGNPKSSLESEMMAIQYAIILLIAQPTYNKNNSKVVIFTDCKEAIKHILSPKTELGISVNKLFKKLSNKYGEAIIKHIEAHTQKQDIASTINEWCDTVAKKELRKQIEKNKE